MASIKLLNEANSLNPTKDAFDRRTKELERNRALEQAAEIEAKNKRDNDMLKIFEMYGDGNIEQADYLAKSGGYNIPPEIRNNADMAKGISLSGKLYGKDPVGGQKFALAWIQNNNIQDFAQRVLKSSEMAGIPIDPNDKKFQQQIALERFKQEFKEQGRRKDLFTEATKESLGGFVPNPNAGADAVKAYDLQFGNNNPNPSPSSGLTGVPRLSTSDLNNNYLVNKDGNMGIANSIDDARNILNNQQPIPYGLPEGSVMIGTANGRPVYQAPNGERFIDDGNN